MNRKDLRELLFREGSRSLGRLGFGGDRYACPLCLRLFSRDALEARELTLDHVPPRAIGGRLGILTCHGCNSQSGHQLDIHAANRSRMQALSDALLGHGESESGRARLQLGDAAVNIDLTTGSEFNELKILPRQNDPAAIERLFQNAQGLKEGDELHLELGVSFRPSHAMVADLRSAYLAAFAKLGFAWVGHADYGRVRDQIHHPDEAILEAFWLDPREISVNETTMVWVESPFPCLLVLLEGRGVVLPILGAPPPFAQLADARRAGAPSSLKGHRMGWPMRMELQYDEGLGKRWKSGARSQ